MSTQGATACIYALPEKPLTAPYSIGNAVQAQCEFDSFPLTPDYIATFTACTICTQVLIYAKSLDVLHCGTQGVPCIGTFTPTATETLWSLLEVEKLTER